MAQMAQEVGIEVGRNNVNTNVLRYIQALLPAIIVAEDQSAEAFVCRVLDLQREGLSTARACWQAGLEMPDVAVSSADFKNLAIAAGLNPKHVNTNVSLARTLARIIHEEASLLRAA